MEQQVTFETLMPSHHQWCHKCWKEFLQLKCLNHEKTLLNLHVCRFGTGLPMTKKQLHRAQVASQEYSARLENLLPDTQYFVEVSVHSAGCVDPPSDMIETFTKKARESQYLHYILAKIPNWLNDTVTGEKNLPSSNLSTFGFQF